MRTLFVTALRDIQVTGTLGRGIVLFPSRFLTNDTQLVSSLLTPQFTKTVGLLETKALRNSGAVVYEMADMVPPPEPRPKRFGLLEHHLSLTQLFLLCLWLGSPELRKIFSGEPESLDAYMLGQLFGA
jgi:hypothetical protein